MLCDVAHDSTPQLAFSADFTRGCNARGSSHPIANFFSNTFSREVKWLPLISLKKTFLLFAPLGSKRLGAGSTSEMAATIIFQFCEKV